MPHKKQQSKCFKKNKKITENRSPLWKARTKRKGGQCPQQPEQSKEWRAKNSSWTTQLNFQKTAGILIFYFFLKLLQIEFPLWYSKK